MLIKLKKIRIISLCFTTSVICVFAICLTISILNKYKESVIRQNSFGETVNMKVIEMRMELRRKYKQKMCKLLGLDRPGNDKNHQPNSWEFLINKEYKLVWCNVFKVASTSWMYNFNILAGYSPKFLNATKTDPFQLARMYYSRPNLQEVNKAINVSTSFLIVRHPFERLLSAYRHKLESNTSNLGLLIVAHFRHKLKNQIRTKLPSDKKIPTFPEFVEFILESVKSKRNLDMHWTPITQFCTPCMFDFKIIAHTETLQEDQIYLIKTAKLENILNPEWKNAAKEKTTSQITHYYSQLTIIQILQLYYVYRYDFQLFNYSLDNYLKLGIPDQDDVPKTLRKQKYLQKHLE